MKITKRQLRKIIKEQTQYGSPEYDRLLDTAQDQIEEIINGLYDKGIEEDQELIAVLQRVIEDIKRGFVGAPS